MADWALILGSSSGFGEAVALAFAESGYNIYGVHLDRKSTLAHVDDVVSRIKERGAEVEFFNVNAADPEKREEVVQHIAERLRERVATFPFEHAANQPGGCLSISIGVASFPDDASDTETLVRQADSALYAAKDGGRNCVVLSTPTGSGTSLVALPASARPVTARQRSAVNVNRTEVVRTNSWRSSARSPRGRSVIRSKSVTPRL